jgi:hypothetical protein
MFAKTIVLSDAFLDMPLSTRCLYFTLGMLGDDDGFINSPKSVMRQCGASIDDLNLLVAKKFIIPFDNGVVVIKHWRIHNYIQKDRYKPTVYAKEKAMLTSKDNGAYTECIQDVSNVETQVSIGKDSIGKVSLVEGSVVDDATTATEENKLKLLGGKLGRNVVYLTDRQLSDLLDKLGLDAFNRYVERLATFIIDKKAHVKSHYDTILKWYEEDTKVN